MTRKQHHERRDQIAAAALQILAEQGPHHLTARNLGERVGMDGSSLFRHFKDKAEILHAALDRFEAALQDTIPSTAPSWSSLHTLFLGRLALVQAHPEIIRLAFNQHMLAAAGEPEHAARVQQIVQRSLSYIERCLEAAQRDGQISNAVPPHVQTWIVIGVLRGAATSAEPRPSHTQVWRWLTLTLTQEQACDEAP